MSKLIDFKVVLVKETSDRNFTVNIATRSVSDLPDNDLLIKVHYSSLNYKDALSASGNIFSVLFWSLAKLISDKNIKNKIINRIGRKPLVVLLKIIITIPLKKTELKPTFATIKVISLIYL